MGKRIKKKTKQTTKATKSKKPHRVTPANQFIVVHNQALLNSQRDTKISESIKTRMKEDETLTQVQIDDLKQRRKELMKL